MTSPDKSREEMDQYASQLADDSYEWYRAAAIRSRRFYRLSEVLILLTTAAIPTAAVLYPTNTRVAAILGAIALVLAGLRAIFHWHENYLRFSKAREDVEGERRQFKTASPPYDDPDTRASRLATAITRIEQSEMRHWVGIASKRSKE